LSPAGCEKRINDYISDAVLHDAGTATLSGHTQEISDLGPNLKYECAKDLCIIFAGLTLPSKPVANEIDVLLEGCAGNHSIPRAK
jgi:hypothetical protein